MRVDGKKFFGAFLLFFLVVIGVGIREYKETRSTAIQNIKDELFKAATSASTLTGVNYYEKLLNGEITPVDSTIIAQEVATLAGAHEMNELFTVYMDTNKSIRYGAMSSHNGTFHQPQESVTQSALYASRFSTHNTVEFELDQLNGHHTLYLSGITSRKS